MFSKVTYTLLVACLVAFLGWVASTVYAMDKKTDITEFRLNLIEENHTMLKEIVDKMRSF
tara:strand:- start:310 stop:489 length:180 start_codon:yes stop_codon:yes gene_type:complete